VIAFLTRRALWFVLIPSLAFNLGVIGASGYQACRKWVLPGQDCPNKHSQHGGCSGSLESMENLTPEQSQALHAACKLLKQRNNEICRQLTAESEELVTMLMADDADARAIDRQMEVVADLRNQIQFNVIDHYMQMKGLLRPDQLDAFHELIRQAVLQQGKHPRGGRSGNGIQPCKEKR
jgi:Spy/CpxP family protein refolding chaperone